MVGIGRKYFVVEESRLIIATDFKIPQAQEGRDVWVIVSAQGVQSGNAGLILPAQNKQSCLIEFRRQPALDLRSCNSRRSGCGWAAAHLARRRLLGWLCFVLG